MVIHDESDETSSHEHGMNTWLMGHVAWVMGQDLEGASKCGSATENTTTDTPARWLVHGAILLKIGIEVTRGRARRH